MTAIHPDEASAREDLCRFLSACYYEPAPEFAEEKLFDSMLRAASRIDDELALQARALGEAFAAQDLQTLLIDYTRLFLGPVQPLAQPYGSYWLSGERKLMQDSTMAVLDLYRQGGFDLADEFRELPDHVAVELEFLYLLIFRENEARREADGNHLAGATDLQQRFMAQHLGAWSAPFTAALHDGAQTPFYRALAAFTERFIRIEEARLHTLH